VNTSAAQEQPLVAHAPAPGGGLSSFAVAVLAVLAIRVCILCVGFFSARAAPVGAEPLFNHEHPWMAWDAAHYYIIAEHGYPLNRDNPYDPERRIFSQIAYFPLVPLIGRAMSLVMPLGVALVFFSNVCSIVGFIFMYAWAQRITTARAAGMSLLVTATFPGAVAFAAGMTEGPFFMLVALGLWLLQRRNFFAAAVVAGIASATRPTGVALSVTVAIYAWTCMGDLPLPRRLARFAALGAISISGLLAYEAFLWHRFGTPMAYFQSQQFWTHMDQARMQHEQSTGMTRYSWEFFKDRLTRPQAWNRGLALVILIVTAMGFIRPMGIPRVVFLLPLVILLITSVPGHGLRVSSLPRYESGAVPLFLLPAIWLSGKRRAPILIGVLLFQLAIQLYYAFLFPREIWVG
jgi:hypothetical protein